MRGLARESRPDSSAACTSLHRWLIAHPSIRTLAAFSPLPDEVDLAAAIALHPEIRWVYPRVIGEHLTFHPGDSLQPGAFSILEPSPGSPEIPLREIDAFLCPGLAFDLHGGRLGRGRGFYDRLLAQARPDALRLGICQAFQIVPDTFSEPHDVMMHEVLF
ncbi:MAG: 5-formyltetrahydrofolate cyclo-ligase [Verrucomicrobiota bacterium]